MNEVATRQDNNVTAFNPSGAFSGVISRPQQLAGNDHFERMGKWLELFIATEQVANVLARTAFVPEPMRGQPENVAAAMMKSLELGIDPLDGLQSMHVVKGKIGFSAEFMRRRIIEAGHEIVIDESTDDRCKIRGRRSGSADWQQVTFTADQARKAKIVLGDYPADKLVARASSRLCRRVFPDVLAGTTIVDEIEDDTDLEGAAPDVGAIQRKRAPRKVASARQAAPKTTPDVDDLLEDEPPTEQAPSVPVSGGEQADLLDEPTDEREVTKAQLQKLAILRQEAGFEDDDEGRADWFAWITTIVGRQINSSNKELTLTEASKVIDKMESAPKPGAEQ